MKKQILVLMLMALLTIPATILAMQHGGHGGSHGGGMSMGGNMIMLQDEEVEGVMGSAHMLDVKEKMAQHGMAMTHHIMIGFMNTEGEALAEGKVAVKVETPDGKVGKPIMMMAMNGAFGADITLDQKGMYHFKFGTQLADGKKRTFHMHYENKPVVLRAWTVTLGPFLLPSGRKNVFSQV